MIYLEQHLTATSQTSIFRSLIGGVKKFLKVIMATTAGMEPTWAVKCYPECMFISLVIQQHHI